MRAAIYARKSNDEKGKDQSLSVKNQIADCQGVIEREGWTHVGTFLDDGISGRTFPTGTDYDALAESDTITNRAIARMSKKRRPGFGDLLAKMKLGEIDVVVVRDMPRISRPKFQSYFSNFVPTLFQQYKTSIFSIADGFIDFNDFAKMLALFLSYALLDKELTTRSENSKNALIRSKNEGHFYGPFIPFGYTRKDKKSKFEHHKDNAKKVAEWFMNAANGESVSSQAVAMNEKKIKSPTGKVWQTNTVLDILHNPIYMGKLNVDGRLIKCVDIDEAIVSEQLYYEVQKRFYKREKITSNRAKSTGGVASGIIKCGCCGKAMILHHAQHKTETNCSYICSMRKSTRCGISINQKTLDHFISTFTPLEKIIEHQQMLDNEKMKSQLPKLYKDEKELNGLLEALDKKLRSRKIDIDDFIDTRKDLQDDLRKAQQRIIELENIPDAPEIGKSSLAVIVDRDSKTKDETRDSVRTVFDKIEIFHEHVDFTFCTSEKITVKRSVVGRIRRGKWLPRPVAIPRKGGLTIAIDADALDSRNHQRFFDGKLIIRPLFDDDCE